MDSYATEPDFYYPPHPKTVKPYPYQAAGVEFLLARDRGLLGDEPGLGKTAQGILLSNAIVARRTLVVCPASLTLNWVREIQQWSARPVAVWRCTSTKDGVWLDADYVVVSYSLVWRPKILEALLRETWDHLILDEAHAIKAVPLIKRGKALIGKDGLANKADRITLMSGTFMPNRPLEVYNALRLCGPEALDGMSLDAFRTRYYGWGEGWSVKKRDGKMVKTRALVRNVPQNLDDLALRLRRVMVRRTKEQVLPQLPRVTYQTVALEHTTRIEKALAHPGWGVAKSLEDLGGDWLTEANVDGAVSTARRLLGEAKAEAVGDYVLELVASGVEKVVVGAWHRSVLSILQDKLAKLGLVYLDGSTPVSGRQAAVDAFQDDESVRVILGQSLTMGFGYTLTAANHVVVGELDWVPGNVVQLVDRVSRIGQSRSVTAHVPVVVDSLDERVAGAVIEKAKAVSEVMRDVRN